MLRDYRRLNIGRVSWIASAILSVLFAPCPARAERPAALSPQTISLLSGPASLKGLGESFSPNIATGTGNYSVPIQVAPSPLAPSLSLVYTGGKGKGPLGMSFRLPVLNIYRTTDKGLPNFDEKDGFAVEGPSLNDELVLVNRDLGYYRLKNEGAFALFERVALSDAWIVHLASGQKVYLGESEGSRQTANGRAYKWFIERHEDQFGREIRYEYKLDQNRLYLKTVRYKTHRQDWSYTNRVELDYGPRSDEFTDYTYGRPVTTALRLTSIRVFHDNRCLRTYALEYEKSPLFSLLTRVTMTGEFGEEMPPLTFGYLKHSMQSGRFVSMARVPKLEGLWDGRAQLEDVNGDALPDILYGQKNNYYYYENLDGEVWDDRPTVIDNPPDRNLYDPGVVIADMNGDGFRDVVHEHLKNGEKVFRYYPGGHIKKGRFVRYEPYETVTMEEPLGLSFTGQDVRLTDLNHDGRVDLLYQTANPEEDKQVLNVDDHLRSERIDELPLDVDFSRPEVMNLDFNGDGIMDFVRSWITMDEPRVRVWYGLGHGRYAFEQSMGNVPAALAEEVHFQDVNKDGQTDIIRVSGSWVAYYLNTGTGRFTEKMGSFYGMPPMSETKKLLFADMNGNGTTDVVWLTKDMEFQYLDLMGEADAGLLTRVDNGMGLVTRIHYKSSTEDMVRAKKKGSRWNTSLPISVPVISQTETTDSLDKVGLEPTTTRTTYEYVDGYYDGKEREFRGFAKVIATSHGDDHHPTAVTETRMHVGTNLKTGADEEILKGKPWLVLTKDERGTLFTSAETKWEPRWLCREDLSDVGTKILPECSGHVDKQKFKDRLIAYAAQTESLSGSWEGTATPVFTAAANLEWEPGWGAVTRSAKYGIVSFAGGHLPGEDFHLSEADLEVGEDEMITQSDALYDVSKWLIGLPYLSRILDIEGTVTAQSRTFYDGNPFEGLPLGTADIGLVTRQEAWFKEEDRWIPTKMAAYNADGLVDRTRDVLGNRTELEYDAKTRALPIVERVFLGDDSTLEYAATYDAGLGAAESATDFSGNTSHFCYDGLGRVTKMFAPDALPLVPSAADHDQVCLLDAPNAAYTYEYGDPISTVQVTALVDRETGETRSSWMYTDGAGQTRQTKAEAEDDLRYIASGWQVLSSQGKPIFVYDAFPTKRLGLEPAPQGVPYTESFYDAVGRATKLYPTPTDYGRTYTLTQYLPLETRVYDERDTFEGTWSYPAITKVDGLGRVTDIIKYNDVDGRRTQLKWTVGYDTAGNITSFADPMAAVAQRQNDFDLSERHTRRYDYDSLGRMTHLSDANAGEVWYEYDDLGNLVRRTDSKSQIQTWVYGAANRLIAQHAWSPIDPALSFSASYHYDDVDPSGPFAGMEAKDTNLQGQLAWIEWPTGTHHVIYDRMGRMTKEAQTLWNPEADNSTLGKQERDLFEQSYEYNTAGELLSQHAPGGLDLGFSYNRRGLLAKVEGGFFGDRRDIFDDIAYDHRGLVLNSRQGNGTRTSAAYDDRAQLERFKVLGPTTGSKTAFIDLTYNRTVNGMISGIADGTPVRPEVPRLDADYEYDRLYQLTEAHIKPTQEAEGHYTISYAYDIIQNLTQRQVSGGRLDLLTGEFKYGEKGSGPNQVTSAKGEKYDYDAVGQMKSYNGYDLTFDPMGRLVRAQKGKNGRAVEYHYDDLGEKKLTLIVDHKGKIEKVYRYIFGNYQVRNGDPTWIVGGGLGQLEITQSQGIEPDLNLIDQLESYVDDFTQTTKPVPEEYLDLDQDGDRYLDEDDVEAAKLALWNEEKVGGERYIWRYIHKDHLGGTSHTTDSAGDLISHTRYHPYGKTAGSRGTQSTYGFAGAEIEDEQDLGLMRFGARWLAPDLGRWVSADPLFLPSAKDSIQSPMESNLYSYALNSPISFCDTDGKKGKGYLRAFLDGLIPPNLPFPLDPKNYIPEQFEKWAHNKLRSTVPKNSLYYDGSQRIIMAKFQRAGWSWNEKEVSGQRYQVFFGFDQKYRKLSRKYGNLLDALNKWAGVPDPRPGLKYGSAWTIIVKTRPVWIRGVRDAEVAYYTPVTSEALIIKTDKFDPKKWEESLKNNDGKWRDGLEYGVDYEYRTIHWSSPPDIQKNYGDTNSIFEDTLIKDEKGKEAKERRLQMKKEWE